MYLVKYSIKRLLMLIPVILGVTLILYFVMALAPGNPAQQILGANASDEQLAALEAEMGLDQPIIVQYLRYILRAVRLDFGTSWINGNDVLQTFMSKLPNTLMIALAATLWAVALGIPIGIYSAVKQYSLFDYGSMILAMLLFSLPAFWLGILSQILFCVMLRWLPATGVGGWRHLVLPALILGANTLAAMIRMSRTSMLDVLKQDYIRTARAKGASKRGAILKHAVGNSLIPGHHADRHKLCGLHRWRGGYGNGVHDTGHRRDADQRSQGPRHPRGDGFGHIHRADRGRHQPDRRSDLRKSGSADRSGGVERRQLAWIGANDAPGERSTWQLIALRFCKNRLAMAGVIVLGLMILAILLAPLYMPYEEMIRQDVFNKLQPPSAQHPLGTDELGRDLLARVLYGGRISLLGGMATIAIAFTGRLHNRRCSGLLWRQGGHRADAHNRYADGDTAGAAGHGDTDGAGQRPVQSDHIAGDQPDTAICARGALGGIDAQKHGICGRGALLRL